MKHAAVARSLDDLLSVLQRTPEFSALLSKSSGEISLWPLDGPEDREQATARWRWVPVPVTLGADCKIDQELG